MLKELITRIIQPTTDTNTSEDISEDPYEDDIHEKIRKSLLKLLTDAGFPNLTVNVGPKYGCSHESCRVEAEVKYINVSRDSAKELCKTFHQCAKTAFVIVSSEILGKRELNNEVYTMEITDHKGNRIG